MTNDLLAALERMDALLDPANGLLTVSCRSATAQASRSDMKLIREALIGAGGVESLRKVAEPVETGRWFTVVYKDVSPGDEAALIGSHPKASALSWSHALHARDEALAKLAATPAAKAGSAPAVTTDERAAFEAWGRTVHLGLERVGERPYYWQYARWAWDAWQARAALAATPAAPADALDAETTVSQREKLAKRLIADVKVADAIATAACRRVAELPDRDSPTDWPEAMLVTEQELHMIVRESVIAAQEAQGGE